MTSPYQPTEAVKTFSDRQRHRGVRAGQVVGVPLRPQFNLIPVKFFEGASPLVNGLDICVGYEVRGMGSLSFAPFPFPRMFVKRAAVFVEIADLAPSEGDPTDYRMEFRWVTREVTTGSPFRSEMVMPSRIFGHGEGGVQTIPLAVDLIDPESAFSSALKVWVLTPARSLLIRAAWLELGG